MKRKTADIDDILKKYLPRASDEEMESARDRFLILLRNGMNCRNVSITSGPPIPSPTANSYLCMWINWS